MGMHPVHHCMICGGCGMLCACRSSQLLRTFRARCTATASGWVAYDQQCQFIFGDLLELSAHATGVCCGVHWVFHIS